MRMRVVWPPLAVAVAVLASGCFFEPRSPEEGGDGGEVCYQSIAPKQFPQVFTNLDGSMACLQLTSYIDQFATDFVFEPSASAQAEYPEVYSSEFGRATEEQFFSQLAAQADSAIAELRFDDIQPPSETGSNATVQATYKLRLVSGGSSVLYEGQALYELVSVATNWQLRRWVDQGGTGQQNSISDLKGGLLR